MESTKEKKLNTYSKPVSIETTEKILEQMKSCICKICIEDGRKGTGFFCKIPFPDYEHLLSVLITNNHVIDESVLIKEKNKITLSLNNDNEIKEIELDNRLKFTNEEYDITIIEIKEKNDGIDKYLELDKNLQKNINTQYIGESIYILHYPGSKNVAVSYGILKHIDIEKSYNFTHLCSIENGSSGAPILNLSNSKIIGINKESSDKNNYNIGLFLNDPLRNFINKNIVKKEKTNIKYVPNNSASRRIIKELKDIEKNPPINWVLGPINDDLSHWSGNMKGPIDSPYEGGLFFFDIFFPPDYPFKPPGVFMKTRIYHPNILGGGTRICCIALNILGDLWSPALTISNALSSIYDLLINPNLDGICDHGNRECAILYETNKKEYERIAREWTKKYAIS